LFDGQEMDGDCFRAPFERIENIIIATKTSSWDELKEWIQHANVDVVAVNLGEHKDQGLAIVQRIVELSPACGVLGISRRTDPETIIAAMRAGCTQFVTSPVEFDDLKKAIERIRATRINAVQTSKRICVIGSSGGAGATTIACNLAMELGHITNNRSALVDLNLEFGDVCSSLDCNPSYTLADVCKEEIEIDRLLLSKALHELPCNVSVLARPKQLEEAREIMPEAINSALKVLASMFPFVVVDLPRASSFLSSVALTGADHVLIVTQLGVPFIRNATRIYDCLLQMGTGEGCVQIVLNRCNANFERITPDEVAAHFGQPIFAMIPNDYRRVQSSLDLGHPIVTDAPTSPARVAIQEMAQKLASDRLGDERMPAATSGFLGKLWRRSG
jgi:pilus assembly protein CpaE